MFQKQNCCVPKRQQTETKCFIVSAPCGRRAWLQAGACQSPQPQTNRISETTTPAKLLQEGCTNNMDSSAQLTANFHIAEGIKSLLGKRKKPDTRGECCESPRKVQKISEQTPASMILIHDVEADNVRMNAPAVAQSLPISKLPSTSNEDHKRLPQAKGHFWQIPCCIWRN